MKISNLQKEKIFSLENDLKNTQEQLTITLAKLEEIQKINESIKYENEEKDIFIHELLTKINFLEMAHTNFVSSFRYRPSKPPNFHKK